MTRGRRLLVGGQMGLFAGSVATAALTSRDADWHPTSLFVLLLVGTILCDLYPIEFKHVKAAGSSIGLVLAMALLGPAPAVAIGISTMLVVSARTRPDLQTFVSNLATFSTFTLVGGLAMRAAEDLGTTAGEAGLPVTVAVVFMLANLVNFLIVAVDFRVTAGRSIRRAFAEVYMAVLPVEIASALLTASLAVIYELAGLGFAAMLALVGVVFQYLLHLTFESRRRGEQLERRTMELSSLQFGLLTTVLKTLSLRDKMTARHSAAVARYARELARQVGMSEEEQDVVHTAALLHDIGKFVFPDSILFATSRLSDEDFEIIKSHPERGAELVRQIEGYGPVADIIIAHHERIDGGGYPFGLRGEEIPLAARMISVADTYDVMVSRDSYREPVTPAEAIRELRRVAGAQLDAELVEIFVRLVEEQGIAFRHTDDADFEAELNFDERVRTYAAPRRVAA